MAAAAAADVDISGGVFGLAVVVNSKGFVGIGGGGAAAFADLKDEYIFDLTGTAGALDFNVAQVPITTVCLTRGCGTVAGEGIDGLLWCSLDNDATVLGIVGSFLLFNVLFTLGNAFGGVFVGVLGGVGCSFPGTNIEDDIVRGILNTPIGGMPLTSGFGRNLKYEGIFS